jgi:uncharacterized protein
MSKKLSFLILAVLTLITAFFLYSFKFLSFDYNFEKFFPANDPDTQFYKEHRLKFTSDNDFLFIAIESENGIFNNDFLSKTESLAESIRKVDNVLSVVSPLSISLPIKDPIFGNVIQKPLINIQSSQSLRLDSLTIYQSKTFVGSIFSTNGKSICLFINHKEYLSKAGCDRLAKDIESLLQKANFKNTYIAGRAVGQAYYVNLIQSELGIFTIVAIVFIISFLYFSFRTAWGVLLPLIVVVLTVVWTIGVINISGYSIGIMLNILPPVLFVVAMTDVIHIISKYIEELRNGSTKQQAINNSFKETGVATMLTAITTSIGFATLMGSQLLTIQELGLFASIGVLFAFIISYSLLPAMMMLSKIPKIIYNVKNQKLWNKILTNHLLFVLRYRNKIIWVSAISIGISLLGISQIVINNFLLEDLKDNDPMKKNFVYFEENYSGARPFEMSITVANDSLNIFNNQVIREIEVVQNYLSNQYGAGALTALPDAFKLYNQAKNNGDNSYYRLPESDKDLYYISKEIKKIKNRNGIKQFISKDLKTTRINGKMADIGNVKVSALNEDFYKFQAIKLQFINCKITGTATLIDKNNKYISTNMAQGLGIELVIIFAIVLYMFKSMRMSIIAVIPNLVPMIFIAGLMGFAGVNLKVSTAIVFNIAFGIAVDDTIHFITKLKQERAKNKSMLYALKRTILTKGKAIIHTTIMLSLGFLTLTVSNFLSTFYLGLLMSLTLVLAVLGDLFLLPALIINFATREKNK